MQHLRWGGGTFAVSTSTVKSSFVLKRHFFLPCSISRTSQIDGVYIQQNCKVTAYHMFLDLKSTSVEGLPVEVIPRTRITQCFRL